MDSFGLRALILVICSGPDILEAKIGICLWHDLVGDHHLANHDHANFGIVVDLLQLLLLNGCELWLPEVACASPPTFELANMARQAQMHFLWMFVVDIRSGIIDRSGIA